MKIAVTGASGYIGSHVVTQLLEEGHHVVAVDLNYENVDQRAERSQVNIFSGSNTIYKDLGEPDVCIHLAWKDGFSHNSHAHLENLSAHYVFIKNLILGGLPHLAVMGTMHEIGYYEGAVEETTPTNPRSNYGIAKNALREAVALLCEADDVTFQWIRAFYILGDDKRNNSIFSKICDLEMQGMKTFPFVSGKNKCDFLDVNELAYQIVSTITQNEINGIINCCSGKPVSLADKVLEFIKENNFSIKPDFGKFPERDYDSPAIWGDDTKIKQIMDARNEK